MNENKLNKDDKKIFKAIVNAYNFNKDNNVLDDNKLSVKVILKKYKISLSEFKRLVKEYNFFRQRDVDDTVSYQLVYMQTMSYYILKIMGYTDEMIEKEYYENDNNAHGFVKKRSLK